MLFCSTAQRFGVIDYCCYARSDTERLQSLTEKQAQKLEENTLYIKELEDREMVLAQNVSICLFSASLGSVLFFLFLTSFFFLPLFLIPLLLLFLLKFSTV